MGPKSIVGHGEHSYAGVGVSDTEVLPVGLGAGDPQFLRRAAGEAELWPQRRHDAHPDQWDDSTRHADFFRGHAEDTDQLLCGGFRHWRGAALLLRRTQAECWSRWFRSRHYCGLWEVRR